MIYQTSRDEDTSSNCSKCQQQQLAQTHNHRNVEQQRVQPQSNKLISPRQKLTHSSSRNNTLSLVSALQEEVRELKWKNQQQKREIKQLRRELQANRSNRYLSPQTLNSKKQIGYLNRQHVNSSRISRMFSPQIQNCESQSRAVQLQTVLLQKQIKEYQLNTLQLNSKLRSYEQKFQWMQKFIDNFVRMAEELSFRYDTPLELDKCTLRKQVKISWRYVKSLINYLIK